MTDTLSASDRLWQGRETPPPPPPPTADDWQGQGAADNSIGGVLARLRGAQVGNRNAMLNWAARKLAGYAANGYIDPDTARDTLTAIALDIGLEPGETRGSIQSGWEYGTSRPLHPKKGRDDTADAPDGGNQRDDDSGDGGGFDALPACLDWAELWADDTEDEWIVEPILPARRLVAMFSAPKVGKSLLMLELAAGIACGRSVLGHPAQPPRRVLYVDYENDPRGDIRERLQAMHYKAEELDGLRYLTYPVLGGLDTRHGAARLLAVVDREQVEVVVIDTVSRAIEGEENSNDTWLNFYRRTGLALKQRGIAAIRLDHSGKDDEKGMRGGSAKYGDVDAVWQMRKITDDVITMECTHRRMRIVEDRLTLTRGDDPLRHEVDADGKAAARAARHVVLTRALDDLEADDDISNRDARELLKAAGVSFNSNDLAGVIKARKSTLNQWLEGL